MGSFEDITGKKGPLQLVVLFGGLRCLGTVPQLSRYANGSTKRYFISVLHICQENGVDINERVVQAAFKHDNSHLLPLLVDVQWYRLSRSGNLHVQALLSSLDWDHRYGVCEIVLQSLAEKETGALIRAFVQSFRKQPFVAFSDLIFLCTPAKANPQILRDAASIGVRAAFITDKFITME